MYLRFCALFLLILLNSCATPKLSGAQIPATAHPPNNTNQNIILSLVLKATRNPDSSVHFEVVNDIRNSGKLKKQSIPYNARFIAYFADASGNKKDSCYFEHPLEQRIEGANEQGKISANLFKQDEAFTDIRVNLTPDMKKVVFIDLESKNTQTINLK